MTLNFFNNDQMERLFLLELIVDNLCLEFVKLDIPKSIISSIKDMSVRFHFQDFPPVEVKDEDFCKISEFSSNKPGVFKSGKSCVFSLQNVPPDQQSFRVGAEIFGFFGEPAERMLLARTCIELREYFRDVLDSVYNLCRSGPVTRAAKNVYPMVGTNGVDVGKIGLFVRVSCFGGIEMGSGGPCVDLGGLGDRGREVPPSTGPATPGGDGYRRIPWQQEQVREMANVTTRTKVTTRKYAGNVQGEMPGVAGMGGGIDMGAFDGSFFTKGVTEGAGKGAFDGSFFTKGAAGGAGMGGFDRSLFTKGAAGGAGMGGFDGSLFTKGAAGGAGMGGFDGSFFTSGLAGGAGMGGSFFMGGMLEGGGKGAGMGVGGTPGGGTPGGGTGERTAAGRDYEDDKNRPRKPCIEDEVKPPENPDKNKDVLLLKIGNKNKPGKPPKLLVELKTPKLTFDDVKTEERTCQTLESDFGPPAKEAAKGKDAKGKDDKKKGGKAKAGKKGKGGGKKGKKK